MKNDNDDDDDEVIFVSRKRMSPIEREAHKIRRDSFTFNEMVTLDLAEEKKEKALNEAQAAKEKAQDEAEDAELNKIRKLAEAINEFCKRDEQKMDNEMQQHSKKIKKN